MEITFAPSFDASLKKLIQTENLFHWRYWRSKFNDVRWFFRNLPMFMKLAWLYRPWNFDYALFEYLELHLPKVLHEVRYGCEVPENRFQKVKEIEHLIRLTRRIHEDNYHDIAHRIYGDDEYIRKSWQLEKNDWRRFSDLIHDKSRAWLD